MDQAEQTYRVLRCLQLYVGMVNVINLNLIFTWKLGSLGISIISGYAAVADRNHNSDSFSCGR